MNVTPDATDQIKLINNDPFHAWLRLSNCTTRSVPHFFDQVAINPPVRGNPVGPNTPLVGHYRNYLTASQFDIAESYTEPECNSELEEDIGPLPKPQGPFPGTTTAATSEYQAMIARSLGYRRTLGN